MRDALKSRSAVNPITNLARFSLLKECARQGLITQGGVLHGHFIKVGTSSKAYNAIQLLIMYLKCQRSADADQILKGFNGFNLVAHNCLIAASVERGNLDEARRLFDEMPERNEVSWTALASGFLKYGRVEESMWYFERNPFHNVVSWTAAVSGFVQNGLNYKAMKLFLDMFRCGVRPNDVTFTSVVRACAELGAFELGMSVLSLILKVGFEHNISVSNSFITFSLRLGKVDLARRIFHRMEVRDVISWTAILDMYVEMGDLTEARRVFDEMPTRNTVSWSAMIARYSQSGYTEEAVKLFYRMIQDGFSPNTSCLASVISAMACLEALHAGMNIHAPGRWSDVMNTRKLMKEKGVKKSGGCSWVESHLTQALPKKQWKDLA
ncbi:hypothetical protein RJ639_006731 [Escallonia herrerae]|uniref:Pentatricopeptide repeat-containing protein n=1 Tax=Escallonia herrerae TaxID=1293975 RepID=A0AA89AUS2_9ASTE|nr:hypothetical protein RJ639_006731 [Escallonia herrerae]